VAQEDMAVLQDTPELEDSVVLEDLEVLQDTPVLVDTVAALGEVVALVVWVQERIAPRAVSDAAVEEVLAICPTSALAMAVTRKKLRIPTSGKEGILAVRRGISLA